MTRLFLAGDVMTGRGIDQVLPTPSDPSLYEPYVRDARAYVDLAVSANGAFPYPVGPSYIWGRALDVLGRLEPDARIINLETSVTTSNDYWPGKGINYRMHPQNIGCLSAAGIDCCVLANNHVLDWGYAGLDETLATLHAAGIATAGAGRDRRSAVAPAVIELGERGRVLVFAFGSETSGVPLQWEAGEARPGVSLLADLSIAAARRAAANIAEHRRDGDIVVVSVHWGGNWGYEVPRRQRQFAHALIDYGGADIVHGHSSHHPKGIEVRHDKPIIYGCGDFLNDYEGIAGREPYRGDLTLMYFVDTDASSGKLLRLEMVPLRLRRFSLNESSRPEAEWLRDTLDREGRALGTRVAIDEQNVLSLQW